MCIETIEVENVNSSRDAYEVAQYLKGVPGIDDAQCDLLTGNIVIDYDESDISRKRVLDEIEYSGCRPCERVPDGIIGRVLNTVTG